MTGYTVHTGSSEKFSEGWDQIFSGNKAGKKTAASSKTKKTAAPPAAAKKATKPSKKKG